MKRLIFLPLLFFPVFLFAQNVSTLDASLRTAADFFYEKIPPGSTVAIFDFEAKNSYNARRILAELTQIMTNDGILLVLDRDERMLELLERERQYRMSGNVDDSEDHKAQIGKELGADAVISGELTVAEGGGNSLTIRAVHTTLRTNLGMWTGRVNLTDESWKKKRFYIGAGAGIAFPFFSDAAGGFLPGYETRDFDGLNTLEGEVRISFALIEYVGIQTGLIVSADSYDLYNPKTNHYLTTITSRSITLPLMVKGIYHPRNFHVQGYGGMYAALPAGQMDINDGKKSVKADFSSAFGFIAGAGAGVKLGPGLLMIDGRYMSDVTNISVKYNGAGGNTEVDLGKRQKISVWLGYEFMF